MEEPPQQPPERVAAGRALTVVSGHASRGMSHLSVWLTVGVGAAFALVVTNLDVVTRFIHLGDVRISLLIFLGSILVGGLARLLGVMVESGVQSAAEGNKIGEELANMHSDFDMQKFGQEFKRGCIPPYTWIVQWSLDRAFSGDAAAGARYTSKMSQFQAVLVLIQMILCAVALIWFGISMDPELQG